MKIDSMAGLIPRITSTLGARMKKDSRSQSLYFSSQVHIFKWLPSLHQPWEIERVPWDHHKVKHNTKRPWEMNAVRSLLKASKCWPNEHHRSCQSAMNVRFHKNYAPTFNKNGAPIRSCIHISVLLQKTKPGSFFLPCTEKKLVSRLSIGTAVLTTNTVKTDSFWARLRWIWP